MAVKLGEIAVSGWSRKMCARPSRRVFGIGTDDTADSIQEERWNDRESRGHYITRADLTKNNNIHFECI
jgi:hypothetical protein